jgi:hypothetical protein
MVFGEALAKLTERGVVAGRLSAHAPPFEVIGLQRPVDMPWSRFRRRSTRRASALSPRSLQRRVQRPLG